MNTYIDDEWYLCIKQVKKMMWTWDTFVWTKRYKVNSKWLFIEVK